MHGVKLSGFNLLHWQHRHQVLPSIGTKVCMTNNSSTLGVIVVLGKVKRWWKEYIDIDEVEVQWLNGSRRGKTEKRKSEDVVNYDAYKAAVQTHITAVQDKLKDAEIEAGLAPNEG